MWGSALVHQDPSWARLSDAWNFTSRHYTSTFSKFSGIGGAGHARRWLGLSAEESAHFSEIYKYPVPKGAGVWDESPPTPFLIPVPGARTSGATTRMANDAKAFFGTGGAAAPSGDLLDSYIATKLIR